ncbi:hypothetical protein SLS60_003799 [Paraconiothyrium brasiliense]|uniref:Uncharacterized protein n=1 Tax=Paraconiothyrium brasiliense TaxID=300254 RepID=A0ABR3RPQ1_9PLEO
MSILAAKKRLSASLAAKYLGYDMSKYLDNVMHEIIRWIRLIDLHQADYDLLQEIIEKYPDFGLDVLLPSHNQVSTSVFDDIDSENDRRRQKTLRLIFDLRRYFHERLSTLKQQPRDDSSPYSRNSDLVRLRLPPESRSAWKDGTRVIRHLQRGKLPETVEQVVLCIMTADAMRSSNCANSYVRNQDEFMRDLHRWKDVVPPKDKKLFEQVVYRLWKRKLDNSKKSYQSDNLSHFQEVFQNLLSELDIEELPFDAYNGEQLPFIQSGHADRPSTPPSPRRSDNRDAHEKTCKARRESQAPAAPRHDLDAILPGVNEPTDCHGQHAAEDWLASDQPLSVLPEFDLNAITLDLESFIAPAQSLPTALDFDFANTSENHHTTPLGQQPLDFSNALSSSQYSLIPTQANTLDTFPAPPTGAHQPSWPPSTHETFNTMTMPSGTHNPGSLMYDQSGLAQRSPTNQAFFPDLLNMSFSGVPDASTADFQPTALLPTSAFQSSTAFQPQWYSNPLPTAPAELDFFNLTPDFNSTSNPFGAASTNAWNPEQQINGYSGLGLGLGLGHEGLGSDLLFASNPTSKRKEPCSMDEINLNNKRARTADVEAFDWDGVRLA